MFEEYKPHKITVSDFEKVLEICLDWCRFDDASEMVLMLRMKPSIDDVWYEIEIGDCDIDGNNYHIIQSQKFNSIKKACNYWNEQIKIKGEQI